MTIGKPVRKMNSDEKTALTREIYAEVRDSAIKRSGEKFSESKFDELLQIRRRSEVVPWKKRFFRKFEQSDYDVLYVKRSRVFESGEIKYALSNAIAERIPEKEMRAFGEKLVVSFPRQDIPWWCYAISGGLHLGTYLSIAGFAVSGGAAVGYLITNNSAFKQIALESVNLGIYTLPFPATGLVLGRVIKKLDGRRFVASVYNL